MKIPRSFSTLPEMTRAQQELRILRKLRKLRIFAFFVNFVEEFNPGHMGALGSIPMKLKNNLKVIDVRISVEQIQKCVLLGTTKVLEM